MNVHAQSPPHCIVQVRRVQREQSADLVDLILDHTRVPGDFYRRIGEICKIMLGLQEVESNIRDPSTSATAQANLQIYIELTCMTQHCCFSQSCRELQAATCGAHKGGVSKLVPDCSEIALADEEPKYEETHNDLVDKCPESTCGFVVTKFTYISNITAIQARRRAQQYTRQSWSSSCREW